MFTPIKKVYLNW